MSAARAQAASVETARENLPGRNVAHTARTYSSGSARLSGMFECSTLQYEKPSSGVMWIVLYSLPRVPFMLYPHGSKT